MRKQAFDPTIPLMLSGFANAGSNLATVQHHVPNLAAQATDLAAMGSKAPAIPKSVGLNKKHMLSILNSIGWNALGATVNPVFFGPAMISSILSGHLGAKSMMSRAVENKAATLMNKGASMNRFIKVALDLKEHISEDKKEFKELIDRKDTGPAVDAKLKGMMAEDKKTMNELKGKEVEVEPKEKEASARFIEDVAIRVAEKLMEKDATMEEYLKIINSPDYAYKPTVDAVKAVASVPKKIIQGVQSLVGKK